MQALRQRQAAQDLTTVTARTLTPPAHVYRCPHCGDIFKLYIRPTFPPEHRCPNNKQRWTAFKDQTTEGEHPS
jgi:hypothetical protein